LASSARVGDYFFCHAGVKPGIALDAQSDRDLRWIRDEFLRSDEDFGAVVVHGHTPVEAPDVLPNRINIDTGAYLSGQLTCLVLEGEHKRFLTAERKPTERRRPAATPQSPGSHAGGPSDGRMLTDLASGKCAIR
jgi:serine/threonine protein phosphatase 1